MIGKGPLLGVATSLVLISGFAPPSKANSWWAYGCVQGMQHKYGPQFSAQQIQDYCQCRDRGKRSSEYCIYHLDIHKDAEKEQSLSNADQFTIGVMTVVICGKRLGKIDDAKGSEILLSALSRQGFPTALAAKESLWLEAYKEVGQGVGWCK